MSGRTGSWPRALLPALVAGLTVWACLLAWSPLLEQPAHLAPLLVAVTVVALTGSTARWSGVPALGVALLHVLVASVLLTVLVTGTPTPQGWAELLDSLGEAVTSARTYSSPVPTDVPPVWPLFLVIGTVSAVLLDLVALTWRRVAAGALLLLALHLVPANLAVTPPWWSFVLVAAGYLTLLALDADDLVLRWGNAHDEGPGAGSTSVTSLPGRGFGTAARIGALAVVGAMATSMLVDVALPDSPVRSWTPGGRSGGQVSLTSPLVDMRRDLDRGADISLLVVESDRRPTYVRHAVLQEFDGREWTTGDRSAVALPRDETDLPLAGVDPALRRTEQEYVFTGSHAFRSRWLPLMPSSVRIDAEGDWRWDRETSDVTAFDADLTTAGATWSATAVELDHSTERLENAPSGVEFVEPVFTRLPADLPASVRRWTAQVTADADNRFAQALALQDWFRSEFDYSLDRVETVDNDALAAFLSPEGRVGYCEQFAAAMAVMARTLGIPSRVAVGFLEPRRVGVREWEFSSHDLHAWPELFFPGAGWVRFEPTPPSRASGVPDYTEQRDTPDAQPSETPSETAEPTAPSPSAEQPRDVPEPEAAPDSTGTSVDWGAVGAWLLGLVLLTGLALTPQWLRHRRRAARLREAGAEDLWAELRDSAVDLGHEWPRGRSPRAVGAAVAGWACDAPGAPDGSSGQEAPVAEQVERLVTAVERARFARPVAPGQAGPDSPDGATASDVEACVEALGRTRGRLTRWQARWLPRSLVRRSRD